MSRSLEPISVLIADDHRIVRESVAALISGNPGIRVVGQCEDGLTVEAMVSELEPDVLLLDITMPGLNGLDICHRLARRNPKTAILILTMHSDDALVAKAVRNGAKGYLLKEDVADELISAIRAVAQGETYLKKAMSTGVMDRMREGLEDPHDLLTDRERQILQMIAEGSTSKIIARKLNVAFKTVDTHRTNLMRKLGIHDTVGLVKFALQRKIIDLE